MSPWKSRWSRCRLVKPTTSNVSPPTRPSASACEDTSMAQRRRAALDGQREDRLQRGRLDGGARALDRRPRRSAARRCRARRSRRARRAARRRRSSVVVVLPLVPVTPTVTRRSPGASCTQAATGPASARGSSATSDGDASARPESSQQRGAGLVREHRDGAGVDRLRGVRGAVHLEAGDRDEHVTGRPRRRWRGSRRSGRRRPGAAHRASTRPNVETRSATRWAAGCSGRIRPGGRHGENLPRAAAARTPGSGSASPRRREERPGACPTGRRRAR